MFGVAKRGAQQPRLQAQAPPAHPRPQQARPKANILGSGSFGQVRLGYKWKTSLSFDVAIKRAIQAAEIKAEYKARKAPDPDEDVITKRIAAAQRAITKEAEMLRFVYGCEAYGALDTTSIRTTSGAIIPGMPDIVGVWDDMIVARFYERPLDKLLDSPKFTSVVGGSHAIGIVKSLASALMWLHRKGVAHCDIKPANAMYRQGTGIGEGIGILIDFGSAAKGDVDRATQESTPLYLAPHMRFEGNGPEARVCTLAELMQADAYALGLVAWELLYRLRHNVLDATEESYRKYNPQLHWGRWAPAALHYDDSEDAAVIAGEGGQDYERVLQQCVHFCCIDIDQAESAAALLERATAYADDHGADGPQGPDADLAAYKCTALDRSRGAIELFSLK